MFTNAGHKAHCRAIASGRGIHSYGNGCRVGYRHQVCSDRLGRGGDEYNPTEPTNHCLPNCTRDSRRAFCYDWFIVSGANPTLTVGRFSWDITRLDWLFLLSLLALVFYGVVPLVRNPQQTRLYWQRLRTNKLAVVSLLYLAMFFVIGTVGPLVLGQPRPSIIAKYQPPMFLTTDAGSVAINCIGEVTQAGTNNLCHGTLQ